MDKHTPGPWEWDDAVWDAYDPLQRAPWLVPSNNGKGFVLMGEIKCNSKSDALLIAAAPELLEALDSINESVDSLHATVGMYWAKDEFGDDVHFHEKWAMDELISKVAAARAALSKARGEQV